MIANLPMYDFPGNAAAHDRFWALIRAALGYGPDRLSRGDDPWREWESPDLLLSQTCGLPFRARLGGTVQKIATPDYGLSDRPGYYHSLFAVRADDPRGTPAEFAGARLAYNDRMSQSGWSAPREYARLNGFEFADTLATGAHIDSARAIAQDRADIAAIDVVTWSLIGDAFPQLRIIGRTRATPGLPYITASGRDAGALLAAIETAMGALSVQDRDALRLRGLVDIPAEDYAAIPDG